MKNVNFKLLVATLLILTGFYFIPFKSPYQLQPAAVIYPNGGERLVTGQDYDFRWTPGRGVLKLQFVPEKGGEAVTFYIYSGVYNETYGKYFGDDSGSLLAELNPLWFSKSGGGLFRLKTIFDDGSTDISDQPFTVVVPGAVSPPSPLPETTKPTQTTESVVPSPAAVPAKPKTIPAKPPSALPAPTSLPEQGSKFQPQQIQEKKVQLSLPEAKEESKRPGVFSKFGRFFRNIFGGNKSQNQPLPSQYK